MGYGVSDFHQAADGLFVVNRCRFFDTDYARGPCLGNAVRSETRLHPDDSHGPIAPMTYCFFPAPDHLDRGPNLFGDGHRLHRIIHVVPAAKSTTAKTIVDVY